MPEFQILDSLLLNSRGATSGEWRAGPAAPAWRAGRGSRRAAATASRGSAAAAANVSGSVGSTPNSKPESTRQRQTRGDAPHPHSRRKAEPVPQTSRGDASASRRAPAAPRSRGVAPRHVEREHAYTPVTASTTAIIANAPSSDRLKRWPGRPTRHGSRQSPEHRRRGQRRIQLTQNARSGCDTTRHGTPSGPPPSWRARRPARAERKEHRRRVGVRAERRECRR